MSSPIADLTYRGYDGPMTESDRRWWAIAKMTMRLAIKRKGFWIWSVLSTYWYLILMAVFYFMDVASQNSPNGRNPLLERIVWKDTFVTSFSHAQLLFFIVAMLIGVGQIAEDNRANALLIYLSKPCTKGDYLAGKWLGIFLPLYAVALIPSVVFWGYLAMSFRDYGAISSAPWLPVQLFLVAALPAALLASLCVGISSLFNQSRWASATLAGVYFIPYFFTLMMQAVHSMPKLAKVSVVTDLYYASVDGLSFGLAKLICNTDGSNPLARNGGGGEVGRPDAWFPIAIYLFVCVVSVGIAWIKIRPVEVV